MKQRNSNRFITILAVLAALLSITAVQAWDQPAFAEEGAVLEVYCDDTLMQTYTKAELEAIAEQEGGRTYAFSQMNTYPTPNIVSGVKGATVEGVLKDAFEQCTTDGVPAGLNALSEDQQIEIRENGKANSYRAVYTVEQFRTQRYYFPNVKNEQGRKGAAALASSYEGKEPVPALITTSESEEPSKAGRFMMGQIAPHEQNQQDWVQGLVSGTDNPGQIIVRSGAASQWKPLTKTNADGEGKIAVGREITFDREVNEFKPTGGSRYWIYYTTDGSEPTKESAIYNFNNFDFGQSYEEINHPVFQTAGPVTIKAKVFGNGKKDSEVATFDLQVIEESQELQPEPKPTEAKPTVAKPAIRSLKLKKKTIALKWTKVTGAGGYEIYRATKKSGKYKKIKTISKGTTVTYTNKKLKKKKTYYYKVRAYRIVAGTKYYSKFSAVKSKKVK